MQAAIKGGEKDEKDTFKGSRRDFIELDPTSANHPLPVMQINGPYGAPAEDVFNVKITVLVGTSISTTCCFYMILHLINE
jgi:NADPH oxidase